MHCWCCYRMCQRASDECAQTFVAAVCSRIRSCAGDQAPVVPVGMVETATTEESGDQRRKRLRRWRRKDADGADAGESSAASRLCGKDFDARI